MPYEDMREYLSALEAVDQLKHVDVPLHCDRENSELQALMRHLHNIDGPAVVLDNLKGYNTPDVPVVFNPYGTRQRTAMTIDLQDRLEAKK